MQRGNQYGYSEYSHMQHVFDENYPMPAVITFNSPPSFYPQSPSRLRALFFFYIFSILSLIGFFGLYNIISRPDGVHLARTGKFPSFGWHYLDLAQWAATILVFFFVFCIIDLCMRHSPSSEALHAHKDRFFSVVISLTLFIGAAYWPVVFVPRLNADHPAPTLRTFFEDVATHIIPLTLLVVEFLVCSHRFPTHFAHVLRDLCIPLGVYGSYIGFSYFANSRNHGWPFEFQVKYENDHGILAAFYIGGAVAICICFLLARSLARCLWPERPISAEHDDDALFGFVDGAAAPAGSRAPGFIDDMPYEAFPRGDEYGAGGRSALGDPRY